jgi:ArsR family transcriptional regulator
MGDVTLENFLVTHNLVPDFSEGATKVLVARFNDVPYKEYINLTASIREAGTTCALYLGTKKFGKQIDYAFKENYTHIVIMGGSELENGVVKVKNLLTREETEVARADLAEFFKVFGDSTRIRILYALHEGELCVCDIASLLGMTQTAVSHQLRVLKTSKLVKARRNGKTVFYSLDDDHIHTILNMGMHHITE